MYTSVWYQTTKSWLKDVHIYITEFKISTFFYTLLETCEVHTAKVICQCMPYFKVKDVYFVCIALTVTSFALYISNRLCSLENSNNMYRGHVMEYIDVVTDAFLGGKLGQTTDNSCCYITYKKCPLYKSNRTKPLIYIWNNWCYVLMV